MFSYRRVPWHGLGVVLDKRPRTVAAALRAARLDWNVQKVPVRLDGTKYKGNRVNRFVATVRMDTGDVLGSVGPDYEVIQNQEAFDLLEGSSVTVAGGKPPGRCGAAKLSGG